MVEMVLYLLVIVSALALAIYCYRLQRPQPGFKSSGDRKSRAGGAEFAAAGDQSAVGRELSSSERTVVAAGVGPARVGPLGSGASVAKALSWFVGRRGTKHVAFNIAADGTREQRSRPATVGRARE